MPQSEMNMRPFVFAGTNGAEHTAPQPPPITITTTTTKKHNRTYTEERMRCLQFMFKMNTEMRIYYVGHDVKRSKR